MGRLYRAALPSVQTVPLPTLPATVYGYIWEISGKQQLRLCGLTLLVFPLSLVPLELQRRIVNDTIIEPNLRLLIGLVTMYLGVVLLHGGLKYAMNLYQGRVAEGVIRVLRTRIVEDQSIESDAGARVAMSASETEAIGGFVSEGVAFPLLQGGIVVSVVSYMFWVEPLMAICAVVLFFPSLLAAPLLQQRINRHVERRTTLLRALSDRMANESDGWNAKGRIQSIYRRRLRIQALKHALKFVNNFVGHLGPIVILGVGGWLAVNGSTDLGTIVAFISGYERITDPSRELLGFYRRLSQMRVQYAMMAKAVS